MQKIFGFVVLLFGLTGCKGEPSVDGGTKPSLDTTRLTVMSGMVSERMQEFLLSHITKYGAIIEIPPSYFTSRGVILPVYNADINAFVHPLSRNASFERWAGELGLTEKVAYDEKVVTFILNYGLLVEAGSFLRIFYKVYDAAHPEVEERIAHDFADSVVASFIENDPMVKREQESAAIFLVSLLQKSTASFARLNYEELLEWFAKYRSEFRSVSAASGVVKLAMFKERLAKGASSMRTEQWVKKFITEEVEKAKKKLVLFDPSLRVDTVRAGRSLALTPLLGLSPRLSCIQFDPNGRLFLNDFKNISLWRRNGEVQVVSGEQAAFSPVTFTFLRGNLLFVDGDILRSIDISTKTVRNVELSPHFKPPAAQYNFGIIPTATDGAKIYIADNTNRRVVVLNDDGDFVDSLKVEG
ncbi:MAG: hypothetical protein N2234_02740, partial [Planctomycetota bacterium]|nr:hypothetical protein [Planctomycetota bacterium]